MSTALSSQTSLLLWRERQQWRSTAGVGTFDAARRVGTPCPSRHATLLWTAGTGSAGWQSPRLDQHVLLFCVPMSIGLLPLTKWLQRFVESEDEGVAVHWVPLSFDPARQHRSLSCIRAQDVDSTRNRANSRCVFGVYVCRVRGWREDPQPSRRGPQLTFLHSSLTSTQQREAEHDTITNTKYVRPFGSFSPTLHTGTSHKRLYRQANPRRSRTLTLSCRLDCVHPYR